MNESPEKTYKSNESNFTVEVEEKYKILLLCGFDLFGALRSVEDARPYNMYIGRAVILSEGDFQSPTLVL